MGNWLHDEFQLLISMQSIVQPFTGNIDPAFVDLQESYNIASLTTLSYWGRPTVTGSEGGFDIVFPDVRGNGWKLKCPSSLTGTVTVSNEPGILAGAPTIRGEQVNTDTRLDLYNAAGSASVIGTSGSTTIEPFAIYMAVNAWDGQCRLFGNVGVTNKLACNLVNLEIRFATNISGGVDACIATVPTTNLIGAAGNSYYGFYGDTQLIANNDILLGFIRESDGTLKVRYRLPGDFAWTEVTGGPSTNPIDRTLSFGAYFASAGYYFNCNVAEIFFLNAHTAAELAVIEAYMVNQYRK